MREPFASGTDTRAAIVASPGGAGANLAAWLARCGVEAHLVARIGDDALGRELADRLERDGVAAHLTVDPRLPTGTIVILVDAAGGRSMITDRGANLAVEPDDLPEDAFARGRHLHVSGYSLFEPQPRKLALAAMERARGCGMTLSVDPASSSLLRDVGPERFIAWTHGADLCFPNAEEVLLLSGAAAPDEAARVLCAAYGAVVVKLGADGALYQAADGTAIRMAAARVTVVDTTGAGDALCAAFLAAWLNGDESRVALQAGVGLAGHVVGRMGGR